MKLFDYWAKTGRRAVSNDGHRLWLVSWAGSNVSVEQAELTAKKHIASMKTKLDAGGWLNDSYSYDNDYPLIASSLNCDSNRTLAIAAF